MRADQQPNRCGKTSEAGLRTGFQHGGPAGGTATGLSDKQGARRGKP